MLALRQGRKKDAFYTASYQGGVDPEPRAGCIGCAAFNTSHIFIQANQLLCKLREP